jgi:hypothetical protein
MFSIIPVPQTSDQMPAGSLMTEAVRAVLHFGFYKSNLIYLKDK